MENEKAVPNEQNDVITQAHLSQAALQGYYHAQQSPREYLHNFLIQAKHSGCSVDHYIIDEIENLLAELKR